MYNSIDGETHSIISFVWVTNLYLDYHDMILFHIYKNKNKNNFTLDWIKKQ